MRIFSGEHVFLCDAACGNLLCERRLNASNRFSLTREGYASRDLVGVDLSDDCAEWEPETLGSVLVDALARDAGADCYLSSGGDA